MAKKKPEAHKRAKLVSREGSCRWVRFTDEKGRPQMGMLMSVDVVTGTSVIWLPPDDYTLTEGILYHANDYSPVDDGAA